MQTAPTYVFARNVTPKDWCALPRKFKKGERVTRFRGHTYGLERDDLMYGGRTTIPICREENAESFFTVPVEFLLDDKGGNPMGEYVMLGREIPKSAPKKVNPLRKMMANAVVAKEKREKKAESEASKKRRAELKLLIPDMLERMDELVKATTLKNVRECFREAAVKQKEVVNQVILFQYGLYWWITDAVRVMTNTKELDPHQHVNEAAVLDFARKINPKLHKNIKTLNRNGIEMTIAERRIDDRHGMYFEGVPMDTVNDGFDIRFKLVD